jgi:predicted oxidoreductase
VDKYHVGSDTILLSWIFATSFQSNSVAVCNTYSVATKAAEFHLDLEDWFAIWTEVSAGS